MNHLKNNSGYSLLLTFSVIIIFTILGMSILTITMSGMKRNEIRENNYQSTDLAEKGLQYAIEGIYKDLSKKQDDLINDKTTVEKIMSDLNSSYNCVAGKPIVIKGETGKSSVCIENITPFPSELNKPNSRLVTFKNSGTATDGKTYTLKSEVELGYDGTYDQLNYAVSTNKGGNLFLFGGVNIRGDIKVANELYTSSDVFYGSENSPTWVTGINPKINSLQPGKPATIVSQYDYIRKFTSKPSKLNDGVNSIYQDSIIYKQDGTTIDRTVTPFENSTDKVVSKNINTVFEGITPRLKKESDIAKNDKPIPIQEKFDAMTASGSDKVQTHRGKLFIGLSNTQNFQPENGKALHIKNSQTVEKECGWVWFVYTCKDVEKEVPGDLRIGALSNQDSLGSTTKYNNVELSGNYYVDGNLVIRGANLKANAVIYVKGKVTIQQSIINPLGNDGTLIIFSKDTIFISNISTESNPGNSSLIQGYFYTDKDFLMYGVGSNTTIKGGISAKNVTFTSLAGNAQGRGSDTDYRVGYEEPACYYQPFENTTNALDSALKSKLINWLNQAKLEVTQDSVEVREGEEHDYSEGRGRNKKYFKYVYEPANVNTAKIDETIAFLNGDPPPAPTNRNVRIVGYDDFKVETKDASGKVTSVSYENWDKGKEYYIFRNGAWTITKERVTQDDWKNARYVSTTKPVPSTFEYDNNLLKGDFYIDNNGKIQTINIPMTDLSTIDNYFDMLNIGKQMDPNCLAELIKYRNLPNSPSPGNKSSDSVENQKRNPSRLIIEYDPEIIEKYNTITEQDPTSGTISDFMVMRPKIKSIEVD